MKLTRNPIVLGLAVAGAIALAVPAAVAQSNPVDITIEVSGTPAFGATVTATATVTPNDGSTVQSITWTQMSGAPAVLSGTTTNTVTAVLGDQAAYREDLIHVLEEPPVTAADLPPNVPLGSEFYGGLQNRWVVVGINPLALEHAANVALEATVVTSSGTYTQEVEIAVPLPWTTTTGIRNVPVGVPVILHGKTQASYDWKLFPTTGSTASLAGAASQNPEFTPDVKGTYQVTVTDLADGSTISLSITAGLWRGVIVGQDANGRPVSDQLCTTCHNGSLAPDKFTEWAASGHAEIFTDNLNTSTHYSESCLSCHTVGYDPAATNGGFDDAADYEAFLASGMLHQAAPDNWTNMLAQFPKTAQLANIQCENCHGPQDSAAHMQGKGIREDLSSDLCGSCHGEPARHGRFQQWQLSSHANYEVAEGEGTNGSCAPCHSANGFLAWQESGFTATSVQVTWTADEVHPQTCQACHDPHAEGTTSGGPTTNATVRLMGDTPMLMAGFAATDVGRGAVCMVCHNSRRGLHDDAHFNTSDLSRAPHVGTQSDILMGENLFLVGTGTRSNHSHIEDACVTCHMEATPPPPTLSYQLGGTNHTFFASPTICASCHSVIDAASVQGPVEAKIEELKGAIEAAIGDAMKAQIAAGNSIDLGGAATLTNASDVQAIDFTDSHGRQGITVTLGDNTQVGPTALNSVKVNTASGAKELYALTDQALPKAGWNLLMIETDGSKGVHNPTFVKTALDVSLYAVEHANPNPGAGGGGTSPTFGGGPGDGSGAVSCTTPYVYWTEIVAHQPGLQSSQWRTDMVARNLASQDASIQFVLHASTGNVSATGTVPGSGQAVFEDLVGLLGATTKGSLEICSDQPLLVLGRVFNQADTGTFGQYYDGHVADVEGLESGQTADLIGLRQQTGKYRTNISVTNGGTTDAEVTISLYNSDGTQLTSYSVPVPAGKVVQEVEPFVAHASKPDLGWGFATVKVNSGSNILTSASVIDATTNDPTTIPMKR